MERARYKSKNYEFIDGPPPKQWVLGMVGGAFARLTVLEYAGRARQAKGSVPMLKCRCQCGAELLVNAYAIRIGKSKSCGCLNVEIVQNNMTTHGHTARNVNGGSRVSQAYQAWRGAINRCYRAKTKRFEHYGGRGITVCDRWRFGEDGKSGFECFIADMGDPPSPKHSLDRKENNDGYRPGNCRWATKREQMRNTRYNRWITGFGKTQILEDWSRETGVPKPLLYRRIVKRGMTLEQAVIYRPPAKKLTEEKVLEIRTRFPAENKSELGRAFGVSAHQIHMIVSRKQWTHV